MVNESATVSSVALLVSVLFLALASPAAAATCDATPYQDVLPEVVAPLAGARPIWLVTGDSSGSDLPWVRPECGMKTLWVVARDVVGDLIVHGRRLDGPGELTFSRDQSRRSPTLVVTSAASERGAIPANASSEIQRRYAFWPSAVYYPSMGCWELTATIGESEVRVVQHLTRRIETSCGLAEAQP